MPAAQQSKQQPKSKPATVAAKRHETAGQQAEWWSCHKGVDIAGKQTLCTASPSSLGQRGHKTSWASCICQSSPSGLSQQGHKTLQVSCIVGGSRAKGVNGTAHDHAKNCLNRRILFAGKAAACASTSKLRLTQLPLSCAKIKCARG